MHAASSQQTRATKPFSLNPTGTLSRRHLAQFVSAVDRQHELALQKPLLSQALANRGNKTRQVGQSRRAGIFSRAASVAPPVGLRPSSGATEAAHSHPDRRALNCPDSSRHQGVVIGREGGSLLGSDAISMTIGGLRAYQTGLQEIDFRAAVHLTLHELQLVDLALGLSVGPRLGYRGMNADPVF